MKYIFSYLFFLFLSISITLAQYNQDSLEHRLKKVDQLFLPYAKPGVPGCAVGIIKDGNIIYEKYFGMADIKNNVPINNSSRFNLCSVSKQFTAACIFLLQEEGKLNLEDDFRKHLPEISSVNKKITVRQLMNHTSGMREYGRTMRVLGQNTKPDYNTIDKALKIIDKEKELNFDPGEAFYYNNTGYVLLAEIIKRVSGKSYPEYLNENIFQPLGMSGSLFMENKIKKPDALAIGYGHSDTSSNTKFLEADYWNWYSAPGPGNIFASLNDILLWDQNFYNNRLGKKDPHLIDSLYSSRQLNNGKPINYGAGLFIAKFGPYNVIEHGGDSYGYHTAIWRIPSERFTVVILSNDDEFSTGKIVRKIISEVLSPNIRYPDYLSDSDSAIVKKFFSNKEGIYLEPLTKDIWGLKLKHGKLFTYDAYIEVPAYIYSPTHFYTYEGYAPTYFSVLKNPNSSKYFLLVDSTKIMHQQEKYDKLTNLKDFVGVYVNREWNSKMKISIENGKLKATWKNNHIFIRPIFKDSFDSIYNDRFFFERNKEGKIIGYNYSTERAMNFRFYKK